MIKRQQPTVKNLFQFLPVLVLASQFLGCSSADKKKAAEAEVDSTAITYEPPPSQIEPIVTSEGKAEQKPEVKSEVKKPTANNPYLGLADAIHGSNEEAVARSASGVLAQNPNDTKAQNAMGLYHYRKGHFLAAQYFFQRALKGNPTVSDLHNSLGLTWLGLNDEKEAIAAFKKAVELDANSIAPAVNLSSIYMAKKDYSRAIVPLEMAVKKGTKDSRLLNNYGIALAATGKYSQAKDQYQTALSLNPSAKETMLNLAILQIEHLKNYQDGLDVLSKLKFLGPPDGARSRINSLENIAKAGLK